MALPLGCSCFHKAYKASSVLMLPNRISSSRAPQAVLIEKSIDVPSIILPQCDDDVDLIGQPDPLSNLRPIIRKILQNETVLQKRFREVAEETQSWNQEFWARHNKNFIEEKETYIKRRTSKEKMQLNADEMSEFYKDFLNKYWKLHVKYNFEWYGRNFTLLLLAFRVSIEKTLRNLF
ncbi:hypothetical protein ABEB36_014246 [Hypothenemus hampei]|uniref:Uncharacterized protein n=1 Tax=Hypothenemus hampei TaxID=57062 RepID=A0ABD1E415_HYPHA